MKAGALDSMQYALIKSVQGYSFKEGKRIDDQRREADLATRKGAKKSGAVSITPKEAAQLMKQPDTPQGHRDSLLMCLLLDHGLRVGEAVILEVKDFDLKVGELTFYRPKVDKTQTHKLTARTLKALQAYVTKDAPKRGSIWRASASKKDGKKKVGTLTNQGATERGLTQAREDIRRGHWLDRLIGARLPALLGYTGCQKWYSSRSFARCRRLEFASHALALCGKSQNRQPRRAIGLK